MRFANKIFLFTFITAFLLGLGVSWVSQNYMKRQTKSTYISKYSTLLESISNTLNQLEVTAEKYSRL